jgi:hypothetical protein
VELEQKAPIATAPLELRAGVVGEVETVVAGRELAHRGGVRAVDGLLELRWVVVEIRERFALW